MEHGAAASCAPAALSGGHPAAGGAAAPQELPSPARWACQGVRSERRPPAGRPAAANAGRRQIRQEGSPGGIRPLGGEPGAASLPGVEHLVVASPGQRQIRRGDGALAAVAVAGAPGCTGPPGSSMSAACRPNMGQVEGVGRAAASPRQRQVRQGGALSAAAGCDAAPGGCGPLDGSTGAASLPDADQHAGYGEAAASAGRRPLRQAGGASAAAALAAAHDSAGLLGSGPGSARLPAEEELLGSGEAAEACCTLAAAAAAATPSSSGALSSEPVAACAPTFASHSEGGQARNAQAVCCGSSGPAAHAAEMPAPAERAGLRQRPAAGQALPCTPLPDELWAAFVEQWRQLICPALPPAGPPASSGLDPSTAPNPVTITAIPRGDAPPDAARWAAVCAAWAAPGREQVLAAIAAAGAAAQDTALLASALVCHRTSLTSGPLQGFEAVEPGGSARGRGLAQAPGRALANGSAHAAMETLTAGQRPAEWVSLDSAVSLPSLGLQARLCGIAKEHLAMLSRDAQSRAQALLRPAPCRGTHPGPRPASRPADRVCAASECAAACAAACPAPGMAAPADAHALADAAIERQPGEGARAQGGAAQGPGEGSEMSHEQGSGEGSELPAPAAAAGRPAEGLETGLGEGLDGGSDSAPRARPQRLRSGPAYNEKELVRFMWGAARQAAGRGTGSGSKGRGRGRGGRGGALGAFRDCTSVLAAAVTGAPAAGLRSGGAAAGGLPTQGPDQEARAPAPPRFSMRAACARIADIAIGASGAPRGAAARAAAVDRCSNADFERALRRLLAARRPGTAPL